MMFGNPFMPGMPVQTLINAVTKIRIELISGSKRGKNYEYKEIVLFRNRYFQTVPQLGWTIDGLQIESINIEGKHGNVEVLLKENSGYEADHANRVVQNEAKFNFIEKMIKDGHDIPSNQLDDFNICKEFIKGRKPASATKAE